MEEKKKEIMRLNNSIRDVKLDTLRNPSRRYANRRKVIELETMRRRVSK